MKTVIFGAGRIGCGLAGQLLRDSGHEVVFVARSPALRDHLNRVGGYVVRLVGRGETRDIRVDGVRAVAAGDIERVAWEISDAGLVITSVGCANLESISRFLAAGIRRRAEPVNILAFENSVNAGSLLREYAGEHLPQDFPLDRYGFAGSLISRAVTQRIGDPASGGPLVFVGDAYSRVIVDGAGLRVPLPQISGIMVTDRYEAWVHKKLSMFSAAHAAAAYLGHMKGYRYIHTAVRDPQIRAVVAEVLKEGQQGLAARYGGEIAGDESDRQEVLERISNPQLCDLISRVGREPGRKLKADDRLVGTARLALEAGTEPRNLGLAVAAALFFNEQKDPSAVELQHHVFTQGGEETIRKFCGVDSGSLFGRITTDAWYRLSDGWRQGRVLIDLERMTWN
ncbi:MAG: 2-dehydropantoate 2-reductase N-terminal domain-containing protein [Elusimicrobiales bacterium]|jgi:mannitol-1-phosphate 5-dehydrogenase